MTIQRKIIAEITDSDFDPSFIQTTPLNNYSLRKAARGVLVHDGKIGLMHVTKKKYHKLPGGGIEGNESIEEGFKREILEETGYHCEIFHTNEEYPVVIEYRDRLNECQISYVLFAEVVGEHVGMSFTEEEKNDGFVFEWIPINDIEKVLNEDDTDDYEGKFIQKRDRAIVDYFISEGLIATTSL